MLHTCELSLRSMLSPRGQAEVNLAKRGEEGSPGRKEHVQGLGECKGEPSMAAAWQSPGGVRGGGREQGTLCGHRCHSALQGEVGSLADTALHSSSISRTNAVPIFMSSCQVAGSPSPAFLTAWALPAGYRRLPPSPPHPPHASARRRLFLLTTLRICSNHQSCMLDFGKNTFKMCKWLI